MRIATAAAGALVLAAAVMLVLAFTTGGDGEARPVTTAAVAAPAAPGLAVWVEQGCGSCHALAAANAHGQFGPDLGAVLRGQSAAAIRTSIVAPGASASPGYSTGMMPDDFAARIPAADLDRLVAFLRASAR